MEETGLIQRLLRWFFRMRVLTFALSLAAVLCLPFALMNIVRGTDGILLTLVSLLGMLFASMLAARKTNQLLAGITLLGLGPFGLLVHIGGMWRSVFEVFKGLFSFVISLVSLLVFRSPSDPSLMIHANADLIGKILGMAERTSLWIGGLLQGLEIEDPLVRTLIWNLGLWLLAVWAGWQIVRHRRFLFGILPTTIILAFLIDFTRTDTLALWMHLTFLLPLIGLTQFGNVRFRWDSSGIDYSDSTTQETILTVGMLVLPLLVLSYFASTISIKDVLEDLREKRAASESSQAEALGLEPAESAAESSSRTSSPTSFHPIEAGPDLSDDIIMTVSTGDLPPMPESAHPVVPRYYWRTQTFQYYTGSSWFNPGTDIESVPANEPLFDLPESGYRLIHQEMTFPNESNGQMFWTGILMQAGVPFEAAWFGGGMGNRLLYSRMLSAYADDSFYTVDSLLLNVNSQTLRTSPAVYPDWIYDNYLGLPDSVPQRVLDLVKELTVSEPTPYLRAIAIQNYLRGYKYSLDVPAPPDGRDAADYFLFDLKKGYCDYYATSMVVMARAVGLPARLVLGYASGAYDTQQAKYFVTEKNSHAWVEIYFANVGWVEFEPTVNQPVMEYAESGMSDESDLQDDAVKSPELLFISFIPDFNWLSIALLFISAAFIWILFDAVYLISLRPARTVQILYRRLRRIAGPVAGPPTLHETSHEFALTLTQRANRLKDSSWLYSRLSAYCGLVDQLTELYSNSLFAPRISSKADAGKALRLWHRLLLLAWVWTPMVIGNRREKHRSE